MLLDIYVEIKAKNPEPSSYDVTHKYFQCTAKDK